MKLALIGCGKMGSALLGGVAKSLPQDAQFFLSDVFAPAAAALQSSLGAHASISASAAEAIEKAEIVLLAVKPGDMQALCQSVATLTGSRLFISIAAGITLGDLQTWLGHQQRVIRSMPNTPALVGAGAAAFARGDLATDEDAATARSILGSVGIVEEVPEKLLDAVTGLSGSGPAYAYAMIEALADGGVLMGLSRSTAIRLAAQTLIGASKMVLETGKHTGTLRDEVTSPGGTTIAGLEQLEANGLRFALMQAVRSATERAQELGRK
jgi:pyrroline-5-carboxylate reductase